MRLRISPLLLVYLAVATAAGGGNWTDPEPVAARAAARAADAFPDATPSEYRHFDTWSYEGGGIVRGLWEVSDRYPAAAAPGLAPFLESHLESFLTEPAQFGYRILHNQSLDGDDHQALLRPWFLTVGDRLCLFPVVYADQIRYSASGYDEADNRYVISETVERYLYGFPYHLDDGTVSRPIAWAEEGYFDPTGY